MSEDNVPDASIKRNNEESMRSHEPNRMPYEHFVLSDVFPSEPSVECGEGGSYAGMPGDPNAGPMGHEHFTWRSGGEETKHGGLYHSTVKLEGRHCVDPKVSKAEIPPLDKGLLSTELDKETRPNPQTTPVHEHNVSNEKAKNGKRATGDKKEYRCYVCEKVYKKNHNLKSHMRKHVRPLT
jgi:hypothetical protein